MRRGLLFNWRGTFLGIAGVACMAMLAGCPINGGTTDEIAGAITVVNTATQTITVETDDGDVVLPYDGVPIFLPGDGATATGDASDLIVGVEVEVDTETAADNTLTVVSITIQPTGGPIDNPDRDLGTGALIIPEDETTLVVNGSAFSRDADLSKGSMDWYKFAGTEGVKYDILARGNAPIVVAVYRLMAVSDGTNEVMAAVMLWTTDPSHPDDVFWVEDGLKETSSTAKAVRIPSFIAPTTEDYYVSVQAAKVTEGTLPDGGIPDLKYTGTGFFDLRSYSIQVTTVADPSTATALLANDPVPNPAFSRGEVDRYQGDWFYFDGVANQNYMIEFRPVDPSILYTMVANVYAPDGSIACTAWACSECKATPFYSPVDARYLVRVTIELADENADPDEESPLTWGEFEWGQGEYLIRILNDDHGNFPVIATPLELDTTPGAITTEPGHLTTDDADVFEVVLEPYRTYRISTESDTDLMLQDFDLGQSAFDRNLDAIGNEFMLFQNTNAWPEERLAGVLTLPREFEPGDSRNTFGLIHGPYELLIQNDDHVDEGSPLYAATVAAINTATGGVLWGDTHRDTDGADEVDVEDILDTDLFTFTPEAQPFWHRVEVDGAGWVNVDGAGNVEDDTATQAVEITTHYESGNTSDPVSVLVGGPGHQQPGSVFSLLITQEDHANRSGDGDLNEFNAAVLSDGSALPGILWGAPGDNDIFQFTAEPNRTYKVSISGANGATSLGGTDNVDVSYDLPGTNRAVSVRHAGAEAVENIVEVALAQDTQADIAYNVQFDDDDFVDAGDFGDPDFLELLTALGAGNTAGVLFKGDTDLFAFLAPPNMTHRVSVTGASGATLLDSFNTIETYDIETPENDRAISIGHAGADDALLPVRVTFGGENADITYNINVTLDDHVDEVDGGDAQAVAALELLGAAARTGVLFEGDSDFFRLSAVTGTDYEISPENESILLLVDGVPQVAVGGVYTYTHAGADGDVLVQVVRSVDAPTGVDVNYSLTVEALP